MGKEKPAKTPSETSKQFFVSSEEIKNRLKTKHPQILDPVLGPRVLNSGSPHKNPKHRLDYENDTSTSRISPRVTEAHSVQEHAQRYYAKFLMSFDDDHEAEEVDDSEPIIKFSDIFDDLASLYSAIEITRLNVQEGDDDAKAFNKLLESRDAFLEFIGPILEVGLYSDKSHLSTIGRLRTQNILAKQGITGHTNPHTDNNSGAETAPLKVSETGKKVVGRRSKGRKQDGETYKQVKALMHKDNIPAFKKAVEMAGGNQSAFIEDAVHERMERMGIKPAVK